MRQAVHSGTRPAPWPPADGLAGLEGGWLPGSPAGLESAAAGGRLTALLALPRSWAELRAALPVAGAAAAAGQRGEHQHGAERLLCCSVGCYTQAREAVLAASADCARLDLVLLVGEDGDGGRGGLDQLMAGDWHAQSPPPPPPSIAENRQQDAGWDSAMIVCGRVCFGRQPAVRVAPGDWLHCAVHIDRLHVA